MPTPKVNSWLGWRIFTVNRNKPQTIPKWKHNSRSKGLECPEGHVADYPQPPGRPSARARRTVRELRRTVQKQPWTSSTAPSIMDCPWWACGPSALSRIVRHFSMDRPRTSCNKNPQTKWIEQKTHKNSRRTRRTLGLSGSSWTVHHVPADCPLGEIPAARARPLEGQLHLPFAWSPESTKGLLPDHRWQWSVSMRCYTNKLVASNPLNREKSRFYRAQEQS
jgi:hypothetical protein